MLACKAIQALLGPSLRGGGASGRQNVRYVIGLVRSGKESQITELTGGRTVHQRPRAGPIKPKNQSVRRSIIKSVLKNTVTSALGPAGTGKTYLACAAAVQAFWESPGEPHHLTPSGGGGRRAAGLLPGDLQSKVDTTCWPAVRRPFDMWGRMTYQKYLERGQHLGGPSGLYAWPYSQ